MYANAHNAIFTTVETAMNNLIASNEFGDWLLAEMAQATGQCTATDAGQSQAARLRLDRLQVTKRALLEFLVMQQAMLDAAEEVRGENRFFPPGLSGPGTNAKHRPPYSS
jgi:hypothetical protein